MSEHPLALDKRSTFGRRRVAPQVCIVDRKRHIRRFLSEALEELGFITHECADADGLYQAYCAVPPDIVVLGLGPDVVEALQGLAEEGFGGKVLVVGGRGSPMLTAIQDLGENLGLAMLPALGTPYRSDELNSRVAALMPGDEPPSPPVDVAEAVDAGWLDLWYQAKVDAHTLLLSGAEALIRLRHPNWGVVPPAYFIPGAGDPHFHALSDFVVTRAMADWMYFATEYRPIRLAINLPVAVLEDPESVDRLRRQLPDHPAFDGLIIEINGAEVSRNLGLAKKIARQLRFYNIGISIDDLGAEWPLLSELDDVPFIELKVDRAFVNGCANDRLKRAACRTVLDLAKRLGASTVAEGVETREDFEAVQEMGFSLVQGFLFHKPMAARKFGRTMLGARGPVLT
ncbi:MAG TPA: EAL domain-containing protein [Xanthobacteraceae bacterium]|nr:EAL domain-containing protein [Xanthobacteraceae bacterium]